MIDNSLVKLLDFWQKNAEEEGLLPRSIVPLIDTKTKEIVDIVGPRRSGKSSILKLLLQKLQKKNDCLYINFEDPYFLEHASPQVIGDLLDAYTTYFHPKPSYIFFDEIQNIASWEKAARKLRDTGQYKIFLTGSSSKLLGSELASLLTGRHISYEVLPLSFQEYLLFQNISLPDKTTLIVKDKLWQKYFADYLHIGGFPAVILSQNQELLKQYAIDIINRDILRRYQVRESAILEKMGIYLLTNAAKTISLSSLQKLYGISYELTTTYMEYFKEAFLLFEVPQFAYSLKTQQKALKKLYPVDTGLAHAVSFRFSKEQGRMLEAAVFLELRRRENEIYYYKTTSGKEVDFFVKDKNGEHQLIQVTWDMQDEKTKQREISALAEAMQEQNLTKGLILTSNTSETITIDKNQIKLQPVYHWLLQ